MGELQKQAEKWRKTCIRLKNKNDKLQAKNWKLKMLLSEVLCEIAVSCTFKYDIKQALKDE